MKTDSAPFAPPTAFSLASDAPAAPVGCYVTLHKHTHILSLFLSSEKLACAYHSSEICDCAHSKKVLRYYNYNNYVYIIIIHIQTCIICTMTVPIVMQTRPFILVF
jgi:hypothetical protein